MHIPRGICKGNKSPSSKFQKHTACTPSQTLWSVDTLSLFSIHVIFQYKNKTAWRQNKLTCPSKAETPFHNDNERHMDCTSTSLMLLRDPNEVNTIKILRASAYTLLHKGHYGLQHSFRPEADGQKEDSLVQFLLLESTACPLCFIRSSKSH